MKYDRKSLGKRIRQLRLNLKLSQTTVCSETDISQANLSSFENGTGGGLSMLLDLLNFYSSRYEVGNMDLLQEFSNLKEEKEQVDIKEKLNGHLAELEKTINEKLLDIKMITSGESTEV